MKSSTPDSSPSFAGSALKRRVVAIGTCLALAAAVGSAFAQHVPLADPIPALIPASPIRVNLQTVMTGLNSPVSGAVAPGMPNRIFVLDQKGKIWSLDVYGHRRGETNLFLDLTSRVVPIGLFPGLNYDERGLLGLAFHPDFARNGLFYTFASQVASGHTPDFSTTPPSTTRAFSFPGAGPEIEEQSVVTEWRMLRPGDPTSAVDVNSARELMRIAKPAFNHNGGTLAFGRDKLLYISLGDGGIANDEGPGHVPGGNAQSLRPKNVLGKILRIDPLGRNSANGKYGIPTDNPFANLPRNDPRFGAQGEIYAMGLRNPYRMSFDTKTGALWAGDVGQNDIEEVDIIVKGGNYGWPIKEGTFLFNGGPPLVAGFVYKNSPGAPAGLIDPIAEYDHRDPGDTADTRVAIIGGFVYRGRKIEALEGRYVFGDYSGEIGAAASGHMFVLGKNNAINELIATNRNPLALAVLGWVQDSRGEIYLLANGTGTLNGATGMVLKLKSADDERDDDDHDDQ